MRQICYLLIVCFLSGCVGTSRLTTRIAVQPEPQNCCRVAVLPFENWSSEEQAGVIAQRIFHGTLVNSGAFSVLPEGDVGLFRLRHRLALGELLTKTHYEDLKETLKVDAIVQGRLTDVGKEAGSGPRAVPVVAMEIKVISTQRGALILTTNHHRRGNEYRQLMHFGLVTTLTGLLAKMSEEIIDDWLQRGVGHCQ